MAATATEGFRLLASRHIASAAAPPSSDDGRDRGIPCVDGSTAVFRLTDLIDDADRVSLIQRLVRQSVSSVAPLRSGLYTLPDGRKPPIDVTAVAIMGGEDAQCYVAVTIAVARTQRESYLAAVRCASLSLLSLSLSLPLSPLSLLRCFLTPHPTPLPSPTTAPAAARTTRTG